MIIIAHFNTILIIICKTREQERKGDSLLGDFKGSNVPHVSTSLSRSGGCRHLRKGFIQILGDLDREERGRKKKGKEKEQKKKKKKKNHLQEISLPCCLWFRHRMLW